MKPFSSPPTASPLRLAVLISGGGTTLVNIQEKISAGQLPAEVALVIASRPCGGVARAEKSGLRVQLLERKQFSDSRSYSQSLFDACRSAHVQLVVLAGFLTQLIIPDDFQQRVMNIHPSLIPAFCGQGMYGHHVHAAVLNRGCKLTGCTVHFCDNEYDHGPIISQRSVPVLETDNPDTLAQRVFTAECEVYPEAISQFAAGRLQVVDRKVTHRHPDELH